MSQSRPALLMLLSRHPFVEKSGRGFMLRQRIEEMRRRFDVRLVVFGARAGDARDEGVSFIDLAQPVSVALNAARLATKPLQTWLYHSSEARRRIGALAAEHRAKAVYVDMLRLAPLAEPLPRNIALIVDYDDLLSERYRLARAENYDVLGFLSQRFGALAGMARALSRPLLALEAGRCAAYERDLLQRADLALFTSPREADAMAGLGAPVLGAPPTMAAPVYEAKAPGRRLIFLGNMLYAENAAMLRALAEAASALKGEGAWPSDAEIEAIGDHLEDMPTRFASAPIRFVGRVDELGSLVGAGVFLAPVTSGTGVKLKVLDALTLGCPVVATAKACEGLSVRFNRDLIVASDSKAVLRTALQLRDHAQLKAMLAARGRAYVERAHAPELGDRVAEAVEAVIAKKRQETL